MPGIDWNNISGHSELTESLCDTVKHHSLRQLNKNPSRPNSDNILYVILTNTPNSCTEVKEISPVFKSDHKMFEFKMKTHKDVKANNKSGYTTSTR